MMTKILFTNSNEIKELLDSRLSVSPLETFDGPERPGGLWLFDVFFYVLPEHQWTETGLLQKRPK